MDTNISALHLGLSYRCNLRCAHCFSSKDKDLLRKKDYIRILDQLSDLGLVMVYYTYGEPLLAKSLWEVAAHGRKRNLIQVLMSNGMLIDGDMAKRIKDSGIDKVFISFDHHIPQKHDANRGVQGAFDKAVAALRHLQDNRVPVGTAVTVTSNNAESVWELYRMCKELGIRNISFLRERNASGIAKLTESGLQTYRDFFAAVAQKEEKGIMFHDCSLMPVLDKLLADGKICARTYEKYAAMHACRKGDTVCVEPNGDISRCNLCKQRVGNYLEDASFGELLLKGDSLKDGCCG